MSFVQDIPIVHFIRMSIFAPFDTIMTDSKMPEDIQKAEKSKYNPFAKLGRNNKNHSRCASKKHAKPQIVPLKILWKPSKNNGGKICLTK